MNFDDQIRNRQVFVIGGTSGIGDKLAGSGNEAPCAKVSFTACL